MNELYKICSKHDTANGDFKDLPRRRMYDAYQRGLALMVYKFFNKKAGYISTHAETEIGLSENQQLVNALHNPINSKFKKFKVY